LKNKNKHSNIKKLDHVEEKKEKRKEKRRRKIETKKEKKKRKGKEKRKGLTAVPSLHERSASCPRSAGWACTLGITGG